MLHWFLRQYACELRCTKDLNSQVMNLVLSPIEMGLHVSWDTVRKTIIKI
jgi:hypothetical protein